MCSADRYIANRAYRSGHSAPAVLLCVSSSPPPSGVRLTASRCAITRGYAAIGLVDGITIHPFFLSVSHSATGHSLTVWNGGCSYYLMPVVAS